MTQICLLSTSEKGFMFFNNAVKQVLKECSSKENGVNHG
jgi:hypothetical protein